MIDPWLIRALVTLSGQINALEKKLNVLLGDKTDDDTLLQLVEQLKSPTEELEATVKQEQERK